MKKIVVITASLLALSLLPAARSGRAGELTLYEASVGRDLVRAVGGPVTNLLVDVDYAPSTAEGGKLYGMSEVEIVATGNLVLTTTGFGCQAAPCLFAPSPFTGGKSIRLTAGNDLAGESAVAANLLTIGVSGSVGHVVVMRGEYLDATGPNLAVGAVQTIDATTLVTVPEPATSAGVVAGIALVVLARRFGNGLRRARASARSGPAPGGPAPRGR